MRISGWAGRLYQEDVAAANVLVNLKVELTIREPFGERFAHVTTQLTTNLFRQLRIRISGKDFDSARCAHSLSFIADFRLPISDLTRAQI